MCNYCKNDLKGTRIPCGNGVPTREAPCARRLTSEWQVGDTASRSPTCRQVPNGSPGNYLDR